MGWLFFLAAVVVGVPVFIWVYGRRLDRLTGPWIANQDSRHD